MPLKKPPEIETMEEEVRALHDLWKVAQKRLEKAYDRLAASVARERLGLQKGDLVQCNDYRSYDDWPAWGKIEGDDQNKRWVYRICHISFIEDVIFTNRFNELQVILHRVDPNENLPTYLSLPLPLEEFR